MRPQIATASLEFELQIQPQHPRVQDDRWRPTRSTGDKRLYRCYTESLGFGQNRACVDDVKELHFGNDYVFFVDTKDFPGSEIELRELRGEPGAGSDQLNRFRSLLQ